MSIDVCIILEHSVVGLHSVDHTTPAAKRFLHFRKVGSSSSKKITQRSYREHQEKQRQFKGLDNMLQQNSLTRGWMCLKHSISSPPPLGSKRQKKTAAHKPPPNPGRLNETNKAA